MPEAPDDRTNPTHPDNAYDPLRAAFHRAGAHGEAGADPAPLGHVTARGDRLRRRRALTQVAAAAVFLAGTGIAAAALAPGDGHAPPATPPSVSDTSWPATQPPSAIPTGPLTGVPGSPTSETLSPDGVSTTTTTSGSTSGTTTAPGGIPTSQNP
ncbi:hypothetical protein [Streptodolium elevatio]